MPLYLGIAWFFSFLSDFVSCLLVVRFCSVFKQSLAMHPGPEWNSQWSSCLKFSSAVWHYKPVLPFRKWINLFHHCLPEQGGEVGSSHSSSPQPQVVLSLWQLWHLSMVFTLFRILLSWPTLSSGGSAYTQGTGLVSPTQMFGSIFFWYRVSFNPDALELWIDIPASASQSLLCRFRIAYALRFILFRKSKPCFWTSIAEWRILYVCM